MNQESMKTQIEIVMKVMSNLQKSLDETLESPRTLTQKWVDLQTACEMKGINFNTVKSVWWRQPRGGQADEIINGRRYWSATTIEEWLQIGDRHIENYIRRNGKEIPADARQQINDTCRKHGLPV